MPIIVRVRGLNHRPEAAARAYRKYQKLGKELRWRLRSEPENAYDPNAIAVQFCTPRRKWHRVGYVPARATGEVTRFVNPDDDTWRFPVRVRYFKRFIPDDRKGEYAYQLSLVLSDE